MTTTFAKYTKKNNPTQTPYTYQAYDNKRKKTYKAYTCPQANKLHRKVLNPFSDQYRHRTVIIINNTPLGHIKYQDQKSFLSYRNVQNDTQQILIKGGLYRIEHAVAQAARKQKTRWMPKQWNYLAVDETFFEPSRMIGQTITIARKPRQKLFEGLINREQQKIKKELNDAQEKYQSST